MIIKMQISQNDDGSRCLVYNQDQSVFYQCDTDDDIRWLMKGRAKAYFHATLKKGELEIQREAPAQDG